MNERRRFYKLLTIFVILLAVLVVLTFTTINSKTLTRYIKREKDEVRAYYTGLYFTETGTGKSVALENGVGYINFSMTNFEDDDVTKRDITYDIETITTVYDASGVEIADPYSEEQTLHVKDVWGLPKVIGYDSCKYNVDIVDNDAEIKEGKYAFLYEERDESAVGKTHNVVVKLDRKEDAGEMQGVEHVSLVVQLEKPYKEVFIINIIVLNRLIVFSKSVSEIFEIDMTNIHVQTFDIFAYEKNGSTYSKRINKNGTEFTSKAFKVTLNWSGMILNENDLKFIHNNQFDILTGDPSDIDIGKPYIISVNQDADSGTLVMYVPQSSSFSLPCILTSETHSVYANVEIYDQSSGQYVPYDTTNWGGYKDSDTNGRADII